MRVLVNYDPLEKNYLSLLAYALKGHGITALSTAATHTYEELMLKASTVSADAILICKRSTLANLVQDQSATLDAYRGSRFNYKHPTYILNSLSHIVSKPEGEWLLHNDLNKLKTLHLPAVPFQFHVLDSASKMEAALAVIQSALLVSIDIETDYFNGPDPKNPDDVAGGDTVITCCGWSCLRHDGSIATFVLPLITFGEDFWRTDKEYETALRFLQAANKSPSIKVMQNGMYDSLHLLRYHAEPYNWQLDTLGLQHATYSELPKDLSFLSSIHLHDHIHWKEDLTSSKKNRDLHAYWSYNAQDCFRTLRIAIQQLRTMPAYAKTNYAQTFKLVYPCLYCGFEGILMDNTVRLEIKASAEAKLEEAKRKLQIMFADPNFNPGSWQQVEKYIYHVFGAKKPNIGKSKSCTDEKNLIAVGAQHPLLAKLTSEIITYRENQKAIGTYFTFPQLHGRLYYSLDPFGTESGRMACRASSMWVGTQAQNIPDYAKKMLIADPGFVICEIDNKQSEARCTAYLAKEYGLSDALEDAERDFYKQLGTLFFNIPYEDVTDFFRNKVLKKIVHGTNYMMGAETFIENIGNEILFEAAAKLGIVLTETPIRNDPKSKTPKAFAKELLDVYHKPFPRIRIWYKEIYNEILTTGQLASPNGVVRKFFGNIAKDHRMLRGAVAHLPQNLSVSILNKGFWKIYKHLVLPSKGEFRLKAQVHDSVLTQFPEARKEYWVKRKQELMDNPIQIHGRTLSIPTDAAVGPNWSKKSLTHL